MELTASSERLSLLYPDASEIGYAMRDSGDALRDLGFFEYFDMKNGDLSDMLTDDAETVKYRQATFQDVLNAPEAVSILKKTVPMLSDILSLRRMEHESGEEDYLYSITEVELYVSLIDFLSEELLPLKDRFTGDAMCALCDRIFELSKSERYIEINKKLSELTNRVREIKSVTIGVNLDAALKPESAGILSVNNGKFRSGQVLEKILRLDFSKNEMTCIAPLLPFSKNMSESEQLSMNYAFNSALSSIFKTDFKAWKRIVRSYVLENIDFLIGMLPEIEFLTKAVDFLLMLKEKNVTLTFPTVVTDDVACFSASGIINPVIALKTDGKVVENDISFDEKAGAYVITGPNRGGKSVITCAVGQAVIMCALGLPVCAREAMISPADNVFCHFPTDGADTVDRGRLGEECVRLSDIISKVTEKSVVLLDETLSSTGAEEASYIASRVLCGFCIAGCRTLFSTHLHSLASRISEVNSEALKLGGRPCDTLVAEICEGERSFKIKREAPDGRSYAEDIAGKYGLSLDEIIKKVGKSSN